ncbi:IS4 family transposase (plasmid) [Deinococcus radiomollis]|uniref:IS4 family transposase n=1 Tax=Deinococcus radiomollis TaxID=468916 RepID=UPI00389292EC
MDSNWLNAPQWAEEQWGALDLGDVRRTRRAVSIGTAFAGCPEDSLPRQCGSWGEVKAAYRLLDDEHLSHEVLSKLHWHHTRQAARSALPVLFIQDTTEIDFSSHTATTELGHIGDARGRGFFMHSALAVTPTAAGADILGLAWQHVWTRTERYKGHETRSARAKRHTEYDVWADAVQAIGTVPANCTWVSVGDRGSDVFSYLRTARSLQWQVLMRVAQNRRVETSEGPQRLMEWMRAKVPVTTTVLHVRDPQTHSIAAVRLGITFDTCHVCAPRNGPERGFPAQQVWCVRAFDLETAGEKLEWILVSTLPIETVEDALERTRWYALRWNIEDYHKCLKTGCRMEARQLRSADRLQRLLGFLAIVAVRLLWLRSVSVVASQRSLSLRPNRKLLDLFYTRQRSIILA